MSEEIEDWKQERIDSLQEAISFFGNKKKFEREQWVVSHLLKGLKIEHDVNELTEAEEPIDVNYKNAHFQVKELISKNRKRADEYKEKLEKAENAKDLSELREGYTPEFVEFEEILLACKDYAENLIATNKYGVRERENIDLLFYYNVHQFHEKAPETFSFNLDGFRSISLVSNRFSSVLCVKADAPIFLKEHVRHVYSRY